MINKKTDRRSAIKHILENLKISSQEELKVKLEEMGFETTQATLSRDLAAMKVIRIPHPEKGYIYALVNQVTSVLKVTDGRSPLPACKSIAFSNNLTVLKCLPSFAPSVALFFDELGWDAIIGTIAGDDTVLLVIRENLSHERFREMLLERLPELRDRF